MTLSMFVVGLGMWLGDGEGHLNHTEVATNHMDDIGDMDLEVHGHVDYGFDDSETMEELLQSAPHSDSGAAAALAGDGAGHHSL